MFEFTETLRVRAPPSAVWDLMHDIERWWPASNPEHESLELLDTRPLQVGTRLRIREKIGGIPGEATGTITHFEPGSTVTWVAPQARYRWLGISITMGEGVTWRIEPSNGNATDLSAHVWATFPEGLGGRLLEGAFTRLLGGIEKDREHTRTELRYLKHITEQSNGA